MNIVELLGRLTKEPELRQTQNGQSVSTFTLAVNRPFSNQQGQKEADFIMCQIWGKGAENFVQYVKKGHQVAIVGRIQTRNYDNQQGQRVYVTEVVVSNFYLISGQNSNSSNETSLGNVNHQMNSNEPNTVNFGDFNVSPIEIAEDDLPF